MIDKIGIGKIQEELRDYQKAALKALRAIDEKKKERFSTIINLPTGAGKTKIIIDFCKEQLDKGNYVLFLADRIALLGQTVKKFSEQDWDNAYKFQLICGGSSNSELSEIKKYKLSDTDAEVPILFASVGTIRTIAEKEVKEFSAWLNKSQENGRRLYIVYDETQHIGTNGAGGIMSALFGCQDSYVKGVEKTYSLGKIGLIGLTATVYRGDKFIESFNAWYKDGYDFDNNKVLHIDSDYGDYTLSDISQIRNNRIAPVDIGQLLDKGILANPDIIKVSDYVGGMPDTEEKEMEYLADRISKNFSELGKTAVIVRNSNMAKLLCKELKKKNIKSFNFTVKGFKSSNEDETLDRDRTKILEKFSEKNNKAILVAISIFDEGIDVRDLNTLYLYAPTNSQVVLRQRVGRVLRKPTENGDKEDKRVIWQYYPMECQKLSEEQFAELLNGNISLLPETEEELQKDKFEWENSNGKLAIPPIIYKEPLPKEELSFVVLPTDKKAFEQIYGTDALEEGDGIGYFYNSLSLSDEKIYVRKVEKDSYMQFLRVLQNDWISIHAMRQGTCSFVDYAGLLGVSEQVLISDIKKICFSLSVKDAFRKNGTVKNTVVAREDDIRKFFDWFISGEIHYRELVFEDNNSSTSSGALDKLLDECYKEDAKQKEFINLDHAPTDEDKKQLKEILSKIQKNGKSVKSEIAKKVSSSEWSNRAKTYTEILSYGANGEYLYRDVVRMRYILQAGIIDGNRIKMGEEEIAFTGIDDNGNQIAVNHLNRHTLSRITKDDWLLIASALVEIPNHVFVTQNDVDEYEKSVVVPVGVKDKDRLVTEYLMALGYADNDEILRYQCKTFEPTPKLLQYMVYEKIYKKLAEEVCFYDVNGDLHADCQNMVQLENEQTQMLKSFGISLPTELNPIDDVIYDYRPYLKAVPYYQGVKAEFLCRMLNDAIQLMDIDKPEYIVDGFGGSGAISLNSFYKGIHFKHVYNDLGTMNTSFYRVIQTDRINLEQRIEEIIADAFSFGDNKCTDSLLEKFEKLVNLRIREAEKKLEELKKNKNDKKEKETKEAEEGKEAEDIDKKIAEVESAITSLKRIIDEPKTEEKYVQDFNERVQNFRGSKKYTPEKKSLRAIWIQNRLMYFNEKNAKVLGVDCDDTFQALIRSVEEYFHSFMLRCYYFYQMLTSEINMKEVEKSGIDKIDLALVFFFYNSISHRHFYNDCTFEKIMELIQNYKGWLVIAESVAKKMRVEQEDALVLLNDDIKEDEEFNHIPREIIYNTPQTLWYLDIPYTSTDSSDYVPDWFNVERFQKALSDNKGIYVVSSRCNVCLSDDEKVAKPLNVEPNDLMMPKKEEDDLDSKDISEDEISGTIKKHTKEFQIFDFLYGFTTPEYAEKYEKYIKNMEVQSLSDDLPEFGKVHLENGREAQYILISFTKAQEEFVFRLSDSEEKGGTPTYSIGKSIVKNNVKIDENYIRRMLASTHYSKVPVEIMITNADIKIDKAPIIKVSEDIGVLPTFRTGVDSSQYMAEPAIIYMRYEKFMDIMIQLLYKDAWEQYKADESASGWSDYFSSLFNK